MSTTRHEPTRKSPSGSIEEEETASLNRPRSNATPVLLRRLAPGVSLKKLAKLTGIPLEHVSRIFNRRRGLTIRTARLIGQALNLPVDRVISVLVPD